MMIHLKMIYLIKTKINNYNIYKQWNLKINKNNFKSRNIHRYS